MPTQTQGRNVQGHLKRIGEVKAEVSLALATFQTSKHLFPVAREKSEIRQESEKGWRLLGDSGTNCEAVQTATGPGRRAKGRVEHGFLPGARQELRPHPTVPSPEI